MPYRSRCSRAALRRSALGALAAALAATALATAAAAQSGTSTAPPPAPPVPAPLPAPASTPSTRECLGFAFGTWQPALDWRAAGHGVDVSSVHLGGEFAARDSAAGDSQIILFPSWWPAGVGVRFARPPRVAGDTVRGVAEAFVADGRLRVPRTNVRAWLKPCAGGAR